jgi:hypothetical protein
MGMKGKEISAKHIKDESRERSRGREGERERGREGEGVFHSPMILCVK